MSTVDVGHGDPGEIILTIKEGDEPDFPERHAALTPATALQLAVALLFHAGKYGIPLIVAQLTAHEDVASVQRFRFQSPTLGVVQFDVPDVEAPPGPVN